MVKPEYKQEWITKVKPRTFVLDPDCVIQQRTPGLWKEEYTITDGSAIFLSSKCYSIKNYLISDEKMSSKNATKGVYSDTIIHRDFLYSLYKNIPTNVKQSNLRLIKKQNRMSLVTTTKTALNNIFYKLCVDNNLVSVSPLKINGNYV